jgi:hypothetical protein
MRECLYFMYLFNIICTPYCVLKWVLRSTCYFSATLYFFIHRKKVLIFLSI